MSRALCGYADLLRVAATDKQLLGIAAELLGFEFVPAVPEITSFDGAKSIDQSSSQIDNPPPSAVSEIPENSNQWPENSCDSFFWQPTRYWSKKPKQTEKLPFDGGSKLSWKASVTGPLHQPIARWRELLPRLRKELLGRTPSARIDVGKVVAQLARAETLADVPREKVRRWGSRIQVITDYSRHLIPFRDDQREFVENLNRIYSASNVEVAAYDESRNGLWNWTTQTGRSRYSFPDPTVPVVILSDFGALLTDSSRPLQCWIPWATEVNERNLCVLAIVPCDPQRVHREIRAAFPLLSWQLPNAYSKLGDAIRRQECIELILAALAYTTVIEPGLLRTIRNEVLGFSDASLEADFWMDHRLQSRHLTGAAINPLVAKEELFACFSKLSTDVRQRALAAIRQWRTTRSEEVWISELWKLDNDSRSLVPKDDLEAAENLLRALAWRLTNSPTSVDLDELAWISRTTELMPDRVFSEVSELRELYRLSHPESNDFLPPGKYRTVYLYQQGDKFLYSPTKLGTASASPIGTLESTRWVTCAHFDGNPTSFWKSGQPPEWAVDWGWDKFGAWVTFQIQRGESGVGSEEGASTQPITQRMRWIPPGSFRMGSPETEKGRHPDEGPQYEVRLTRGFWMFDTPVTQELWQAVMGENSSHFKGNQRPVEKVRWEAAQRFLNRLNDRFGEKMFVLPSEAQWEYACRAGSTTAYYFGDDPAKLDECAWYSSNSGGQTHDVASKQRNAWGLYDMLGNVWEWCNDYWRDKYQSGSAVDPTGPTTGHSRVLRGGSWYDSAQSVRSADRYFFDPAYRYNNIGFRCAQVPGMAEPAASASPPEEDREPVEPPADPTNGGEAAALKIDLARGSHAPIPLGSVILIRSDVDSLDLRKIVKPDWASAIGRDRYGLWAEFTISLPVPPQRRSFWKRIWPTQKRPQSKPEQLNSNHVVVQRMRWIPPGRFLMGSPDGDEMAFSNEKPQHEVTIAHGYWLFDTPVTQALWQAVMGDNPSHFRGGARPVEKVSWDDCQIFLEKIHQIAPGLDLVLPTEAQWEYACRAGTTTRYAFSDEITREQANYSNRETSDVCTFPANTWGLYDMHGNVWEWCRDWYGEYPSEAQVDPVGPTTGRFRVLRGGSWFHVARYARSADRDCRDPAFRFDYVGFRCAQVPKASRTRERMSEGTSQERDATPPDPSE